MNVPEKVKKDFMSYLLAKKIQIRPVWKLIHTLPMYKDCQTYQIDNALSCYGCCVNIPCSVGIKAEEIEYIADNIVNYFMRN
ncbi:MAG: DegT/DnrJ/EryC1/StrS family aminotransferase [Candidatus Schekmanbacteria bacterium]|nr:DegT/DnrJ/EryC1/StrS family aminotransferase [Candidatus Schekmanbacteria bacterium]